MALLRRIARPLMSTIYIYGGVNALRHAEGHAKQADPFLSKISGQLPAALPKDSVALVRLDAAVKIGAGAALATGRVPRIAALLLAGSLVPTTLAGHPFWEVDDAQAKSMQKVQFAKNLSLLGGLLIAAGDTAGRPSLGWRARRLSRGASKRALRAAASASDRAGDAAGSVRHALPVG